MIGRTISHYRVTGKLGIGGMGVVYEAEDTKLSRRVALKFLPEELAGDAEAARRLAREAQTIASLNHPQICTIYEIGEHEGAAFIVMERCDGANLKLHMARNTLTMQEIVSIALQITQALETAHASRIVHRDIKPGNIIVTPAGQVKVLDFGLARRFTAPDDTGPLVLDGSTIPGRPMGTANYMAPERILQEQVDPRSDLFSLGVVMYEMATGRLPFGGASPSETVTNVLEKEPVPLTTLATNRPIELERIVKRLLAKRPDDRYQSAAALERDLRALQAQSQPSILTRLVSRWRKPPS
ncbi:MAG: serine/threonine protein kinase [Acidobacteria bacterium]|nr:serine/threonine protein kinase [Acidobacteriota bacterium]